MKITKLLAMLLALCMILCCFAACDSSDKDDDDEDEKVEDKDKDEDEDEDEDDKSKDDDEDEDDDKSKDDDEDEDDDKSKDDDKDEDTEEVVSKAEGVEGEWEGTVDLADVFASMGYEIDGSLKIGFTFKFDDDECTFKATAPSSKEVEKFAEAYVDFAVDMYKEMLGIDDDDELAEEAGYDSFDEFYNEGYESALEEIQDMVDEFEDSENTCSYEYDNGILTLEGDVEIEIELDGDTFVILDEDDENIAMVLTGVEFERQ